MKKDILRPKNIGGGTWNKKIEGKLAEQAKFYSKAGKVLEKMGYIGVVVDGIISVYNNVQEGMCLPKTLIDLGVDLLVSVSLLGMGTAITLAITTFFAAFGTITLPVIGTVGGATLGVLIGTIFSIVIVGILGYLINKKDNNGKSVIDQIKDFIWNMANGNAINNCSLNE